MSSKLDTGSSASSKSSSSTYSRERRSNSIHAVIAMYFLGDLCVVTSALFSGYWLRFFSSIKDFGLPPGFAPSYEAYSSHIFLAVITIFCLLVFGGHYKVETFLRSKHSAFMLLKPIFAWGAIFTSLSLILKIEPSISRLFVLYSVIILAVLMPLWRFLFAHFVVTPFYADRLRLKTLVVGFGPHVEELIKRSESNDINFPLLIEGVLMTQSSNPSIAMPSGIKSWQGDYELEQIFDCSNFDNVVLADTSISSDEKAYLQRICAREMIEFMVIPSDIQKLQSCLTLQFLYGIPLLSQQKQYLDRIDARVIKRLVDIFGALIGLIIFSPIIAYYCWRVRCESPGSPFYRQIRLTRNGKPFEIIKIRSMFLNAEDSGVPQWCKNDDSRRLKVGSFMRAMNIDELPQFWNVLKGDMSLVGPRPERPELIEEFKFNIDYYNLRLSVKAGMSGWAQINGWRGDTDLHSRIAYDIDYIERAGFWFDLYIILRSFYSIKNAH